MSALTSNDCYELNIAASTMIERLVANHVTPIALNDVKAVFNPRPDICEIVFPFQAEWRFGAGDTHQIQFSLANPGASPPAPCSETFVDDVTRWLERRRRIAYQRGLVHCVISELNGLLRTPAQMRYLWPTMLLVCRSRESLASIANKVEEFKPVRCPAIPHNLREALKEVSGFLTAASLLEPKEYPIWPGEVGLSATRSFNFEAHGMKFRSI